MQLPGPWMSLKSSTYSVALPKNSCQQALTRQLGYLGGRLLRLQRYGDVDDVEFAHKVWVCNLGVGAQESCKCDAVLLSNLCKRLARLDGVL